MHSDMQPSKDILYRFHQVLVREIRESRPEYLEQPFTVAEIYQNLVPYRTHRDLIGVEMNGDYEDALLRLLAGEGNYLLLESDVARREIREELEGPNPNTGLFRDFAAADVRLNPDRMPALPGDTTRAPEVSGAFEAESSDPPVWHDGPVETEAPEDLMPVVAAEAPTQTIPGESATEDGVVGRIELVGGPVEDVPEDEARDHALDSEPAVDDLEGSPDDAHEVEPPVASGAPVTDPSPAGGETAACHWCRQELPGRDVLNFCPFCGSDLRLSPCPKCGEEMEHRWQFCVACGTEVE